MADKATCECFAVPEERWTRHYDATEPGSMVEPNPDCQVHFAAGKPTTRQDNPVQCCQCLGTDTTYQKFSGGKEYYCRDCDEVFPYAVEVHGERVDIAPNPNGQRVGPPIDRLRSRLDEIRAVLDEVVPQTNWGMTAGEHVGFVAQQRVQRIRAVLDRQDTIDCPEPVAALDFMRWLHAEAVFFGHGWHGQWMQTRETVHRLTAERDALQTQQILDAEFLEQPSPEREES